jgi:hypothetical protein
MQRICHVALANFSSLDVDATQEPGVIEKLREQRLEPVTPEQGRAVAQKIRAVKYLECR